MSKIKLYLPILLLIIFIYCFVIFIVFYYSKLKKKRYKYKYIIWFGIIFFCLLLLSASIFVFIQIFRHLNNFLLILLYTIGSITIVSIFIAKFILNLKNKNMLYISSILFVIQQLLYTAIIFYNMKTTENENEQKENDDNLNTMETTKTIETMEIKENENEQKENDEKIECSICYEGIYLEEKKFVKTNCGHIYHKKCLYNWLNRKNKICPLCRGDLTYLNIPFQTDFCANEEEYYAGIFGEIDISVVGLVGFPDNIELIKNYGVVLNEKSEKRFFRIARHVLKEMYVDEETHIKNRDDEWNVKISEAGEPELVYKNNILGHSARFAIPQKYHERFMDYMSN